MAIAIVPERTVFFFTMKASANLRWRTHNFPGRRGREAAFFFHWSSFQFYDDAIVNKGIHTIKFGFTASFISACACR